ncbi:MAG: tyrosine/phenylalanine carboxypeptidase domain-containing protein [Bacteroidota bacterium]
MIKNKLELERVDYSLHQLVKEIEILNFINPTNVETERKKFIQSRGRYTPQFKYKNPSVNFASLKRKLNKIPIEVIGDDSLEFLYEQTIQSFCDRLDILNTIDTSDFLDRNLRYFGEPQKRDVDNAGFILYCPHEENVEKNEIDHQTAFDIFSNMIDDYGFEAEIIITKKIISKAMVKNQKRQVLLKNGAIFDFNTLHGTAHHEIGVHMVTTVNSNLQSLKIFNSGLPLFTKTQEGLAIMAEYLSGHLSVWRLKELALRVMSIHKMINGESFKKVFDFVYEEGRMKEKDAFYMVTRIFRGRGCTKDHLYLKGFAELLRHKNEGKSFDNLLIGKTSLAFLPLIDELIDKGIAQKPSYITKVFENEESPSDIVEFIIKGLK